MSISCLPSSDLKAQEVEHCVERHKGEPSHHSSCQEANLEDLDFRKLKMLSILARTERERALERRKQLAH
jgi:hypothetical protein